jgi:hypothetical protein
MRFVTIIVKVAAARLTKIPVSDQVGFLSSRFAARSRPRNPIVPKNRRGRECLICAANPIEAEPRAPLSADGDATEKAAVSLRSATACGVLLASLLTGNRYLSAIAPATWIPPRLPLPTRLSGLLRRALFRVSKDGPVGQECTAMCARASVTGQRLLQLHERAWWKRVKASAQPPNMKILAGSSVH